MSTLFAALNGWALFVGWALNIGCAFTLVSYLAHRRRGK